MPMAPAPSRTGASWSVEPQVSLTIPSGTGASTGQRLLHTSIDTRRSLYLESSVTNSQQESKEMPKHLKIGKHVTATFHLDSPNGRGFQSPVMSTNLVPGSPSEIPPRRSYMQQSCPSHSFKISLLSLWSSSSPPPSYQFSFLESSDSSTCPAALSGSEVVDGQRASRLTDYETPPISC